VLEITAEAVLAEIEGAARTRAAAGVASYLAAPVTVRKGVIDGSGQAAVAIPEPLADTDREREVVRERHERGTEWGSIVHEALEAALRDVSVDRLRALCRGWLIAAERPMDALGEPLELAELLELVAAVRQADLWQRALAADCRLTEVPFAIALGAEEYAILTGGGDLPPDTVPLEIIDGRIDLAFREAGGWTIVDYKSDAGGTRIPAELMRRYQTQVRLYARIWERLTGETVTERRLLFTAGPRPVAVAVT
jgi:ATP-dependent exoDNAse (exonuclease V) beta subunit